ncbi:MAG: hydroxyacylglutathione hydrolase [Pseudomonadales bacterium]|nr:hydroxyacylglutathione hydrolase [Pseudomonadales bacterium]
MLAIHGIPAFNDNYIWVFTQDKLNEAYVVDPGDAEPVMHFLEKEKLDLKGIFLTHHHFDHSGGIQALKRVYPDLCVWGSEKSTLDQIDCFLSDNDVVEISESCHFRVIAIPGHTLDHICFYHENQRQPLAFVGDTLFAGGCGRIFEGSPRQMYNSLQKLATLPPQTLIYCAHEYTRSNLEFACLVEPQNQKLQTRLQTVITKRQNQLPTVPSALLEELDTNPFLRCDQKEVIASALKQMNPVDKNLPKPEDIFATIRNWKDSA